MSEMMSDVTMRDVTMRDAVELLAQKNVEIAELQDALRFLVEPTKWRSVDRDNMEFEGRVTCYQLDRARAALASQPIERVEDIATNGERG